MAKEVVEEIAPLPEGLITSEALEKWRERIGVKLRIGNIFNRLASKEAIAHFVDSIGDVNPLWCDEEYAKKTRCGRIVAPPSWLHSVFVSWVLQGLPGVQAFHSGGDWEFFKPVFEGDYITPESIFTGFDIKRSKFAGKMCLEYQQANYYNQRSELVARCNLWLVRSERLAARKKGKYSRIELPHPWTEDELKKVEDEVLAEQIRGSKTRYWEDVEVGEELPPLVKGPLTLTDMVCMMIGSNPVNLRGFGAALRQYREHPAWAFRDPNTKGLEPILSVHFNKNAANAVGTPYPYDGGFFRHCLYIQFITDWMGDDGWLKRNYAKYDRFFYLSDVMWLRGKVTRKYVDENGEYCVDIKTSGINQRGEDIMPGESTVILPSREKDTWPVSQRLNQ